MNFFVALKIFSCILINYKLNSHMFFYTEKFILDFRKMFWKILEDFTEQLGRFASKCLWEGCTLRITSHVYT